MLNNPTIWFPEKAFLEISLIKTKFSYFLFSKNASTTLSVTLVILTINLYCAMLSVAEAYFIQLF